MNKSSTILIVFITCLSVSSDIQKKIIRQDGFEMEFHVYLNSLNKTKEGRDYFWFKSGEIHHSISTPGGLVLHTEFNKYYRSKQLAENGNFEYGLKTGAWKSWHENGNLKTYLDWELGLKDGLSLLYDESGALIQSGTYKNNIKVEYWINHKIHDTLYLKNDSVYSEKPKSKTGIFLQEIFKKQDSTEKALQKIEKQQLKIQDSINIANKKAEKAQKVNDTTKSGFLNKLFKKKD